MVCSRKHIGKWVHFAYNFRQQISPNHISNLNRQDFLGGPVVKNQPSNAGHVGSIPSQELISHMPQATQVLITQLLSPLSSGAHGPQLNKY